MNMLCLYEVHTKIRIKNCKKSSVTRGGNTKRQTKFQTISAVLRKEQAPEWSEECRVLDLLQEASQLADWGWREKQPAWAILNFLQEARMARRSVKFNWALRRSFFNKAPGLLYVVSRSNNKADFDLKNNQTYPLRSSRAKPHLACYYSRTLW